MADDMKKVKSGDPLVIPAQAYNAFIDAARDLQGRRQEIGNSPRRQFRQTGSFWAWMRTTPAAMATKAQSVIPAATVGMA